MTNTTAKPLAQRKASPSSSTNKDSYNIERILQRVTYGVPAPRRILTPGLLLKKHDHIRNYLVNLQLTTAERDAAFYLLRLYAYYGKVYPKAPNYTEDCYRSKRSFWRAVAKLEGAGLIDRINRYLHHLQISNSYRLDKLALCLARYLAEHGCPFQDKFTLAIFRTIIHPFWRTITTTRVRLRDPYPLAMKV